MTFKERIPKKTKAILTACAMMVATAPLAQADQIAFTSFEDAVGEMGFVTSIVAPDPVPSSPAIWWIYPSAATPNPGDADMAIFASDSYNDYFTVNYPGTIPLVSTSNPAVTGRDGAAELTAEDVGQDGISGGTVSITFDPVNVNGYSNVQVKMLLASTDALNFETSDYIRVECHEVLGPVTRIGGFTADGTAAMAQDTDFDDVGDGTALGLTYQEFTFDVPTGVVSFQLELDVSVDSSEEVFIDNIRIEGTPGGTVRDPIMLVEATDLDYGRLAESGTVDQVVTITNHPSATATLVVDGTTALTGADAGNFSIQTALPLNIAPGASEDVTVRLTAPASGGDIFDDALLTLHSNDNVSATHDVNLTGRVFSTTPVTVEVSGVQNPPTTFGTIDEAVDYLDVNAVGAPWVINVTTDGPAVEPSCIDLKTAAFGGVTINGDADANDTPYTIITDAATAGSQANYATGTTYAALVLEADEATYNINNLIFVPAYVGAGVTLDDTVGGSSGVRVMTIDTYENGPLTAFDLTLEDITIAGSKTGNVAAMDPDTNEWADTTHYGRGINTFSSSTEDPSPTFANMVMRNVKIFNTELENFSHGGDYMNLDVLEGCVFAWSGESCFVVGGTNTGTLNIQGTATDRILVRGSGQVDVDEEGMTVVPDADYDWTYMGWVDVLENGGENDMGPGQGPTLMEYCRFAYNSQTNDDADGTDTGIRYGYGDTAAVSTTTDRTISNCTFHDGQNPAGTQYAINFYGLMDGITFNVTDCILSGAGDTGINMRAGGESTTNLTNTALVTAGTDALAAEFDGTYDGSAGNFTLNQTNVINDDPAYVSTTYTYGASDDFLRPSAAAYDAAASGGGPLFGGAGPGNTSVVDWALYN
ncbi:hypothetical protein KQI84_13950 [bacterium]|nr:hypothetical protein [bacterium]